MPLLSRRCAAEKSSLRSLNALPSKAFRAFDPTRGGLPPPRAPPPTLGRIRLNRGFSTSCKGQVQDLSLSVYKRGEKPAGFSPKKAIPARHRRTGSENQKRKPPESPGAQRVPAVYLVAAGSYGLLLLKAISHAAQGHDAVAIWSDCMADLLDMGVEGARIFWKLASPNNI